jgi:hypothetical protein
LKDGRPHLSFYFIICLKTEKYSKQIYRWMVDTTQFSEK